MIFYSYMKVALTTTFNILVYVVTLGRFLWLEGRVRNGVFRNWIRRFRFRPQSYARPASDEALARLVRNAKSLRVFGSGHSFNSAIVAEDTLVSLDRYSGVLWKDLAKKQLGVRAGMRVRDVVRALLDDGLAFEALPSHDAQSMAGILSTDVHGTGRDWGFVSQSIRKLKVIDGRGDIIECEPSDNLFKAAIGGIGAAGIIVEVVVEAVGRFNVEQKTQVSSLPFVKDNIDQLLMENDHLSLYLFPFTDKCQINTWNRTGKAKSTLGPLREFVSISLDALLAAWLGNLFAYLRLLPAVSTITHSIKRGTNLVLESHAAFNRTIYHLHQELEFAVPFEDTFQTCRRFIDLYEEMYADTSLPYTLFEIRFTPSGHDRTLIGAGRNRRSAWIDLLCNDSAGFETYFEAAEKMVQAVGARPHLGKYCKSIDAGYMARVHGEKYTGFCELKKQHDPEGKFANEFTRRLFGN